MKTTFLKSVLFLALSAGTLVSCVNDDDYGIPNMDCTETSLEPTIEVSSVPASATPTQYMQDEIIEAYVTSSDEGGNFFKTISFQTLPSEGPVKGFSVPVDATSTFVNFTPGRKVYVKLQNLYTDLANGGVRIGALFLNTSGVASVGRMTESQYKNVLVRSCEVVNEDDLVRTMTIAEAKNDANINTLIELDAVQFTQAAIGKTYYDAANQVGGATNHLLTDAGGNTVIFRTSSFANFAGRQVAGGLGKVRGVMTKFGSDYQFMARTIRDIKLDGPRATPIFSEDFTSAIDGTNLNLPGWTNFAEAGTRVWREEQFGGNGYAELSSFGSGNASNIVWLVTPGIDMDEHTDEVLTFRTAQHHLDVDAPGNSLVVYVSTNFTGDVATATWEEIDVNLPTTANDWYEFVSSGSVDLSGYTGTLHVAFKFIGSGTDLTLDGAFQIDDVTIVGNE